MDALLKAIQYWYADQCNGDWEHSYGIRIETLDNPGWMLTVNLQDTLLENRTFLKIEREETENSWIFCSVENKKFKGAAGPHQLTELISIFLSWARQSN